MLDLSILVPAYNAEESLPHCLDSLLNQGLNKDQYEILVMNDGSTDSTEEILSAYQKLHPQLTFFTQTNSGDTATRTALLKKATGNYIYYIDSDDYLQPHSLSKVLGWAKEKDQCLVGFGTQYVHGFPADQSDFQEMDLSQDPKLQDLSVDQFIEQKPNHRYELWWYMVKRNIIQEHGISFSDYHIVADVVFTMKCLFHSKQISYFDLPLHYYVQGATSFMRNKNFDKRENLIRNTCAMILDFSKTIRAAGEQKLVSPENLKILRARQDIFTLSCYIKMALNKSKKKDFLARTKAFKKAGVLPVKQNYFGNEVDKSRYFLAKCGVNLFSAFVK